MGEIADMMLEGTLCERCGELMSDLIPEEGDVLKEPPGYPRLCASCEKDPANEGWPRFNGGS